MKSVRSTKKIVLNPVIIFDHFRGCKKKFSGFGKQSADEEFLYC